MGPFRKERGKGRGQMGNLPPPHLNLTFELDKHRFLEDPREFMLVPVTSTCFTMMASPLYLFVIPRTYLCCNKLPKL